MNQYGAQAARHWQEHLPERYRSIPDPSSFFTTMGEEIASEVQLRTEALLTAAPTTATGDYLQNLAAISTARMQAESEVLREMVLLAPETEETPPAPERPWTPMVLRQGDPGWDELMEDEEELREGLPPTT